ncbi:hypothetical protein Lsed01_00855 [Demequina sediminis]|uniref:Uncharacterized protein n=1 Tax=Demequina sediminis TaxID=1930058 RepID=A0ABP9WHH4_9MICO|nr:hypothetical protein [Demequina sediminis]BDZ62491.1 hypothetical protein GCM10025873_22820 [Demequina sediminis]
MTNTTNTEARFYDLNDTDALAAVLQGIRRNVKRSVTPADIRSAVLHAEQVCIDQDIYKNAREARGVHIIVNPERNRQPKARSYNGIALAVNVILRWDTKKNAWYIDLDASGREAALYDTRANAWDHQVVIPDGDIDVERVLAQAGISLGDRRITVGA